MGEQEHREKMAASAGDGAFIDYLFSSLAQGNCTMTLLSKERF